MLSQSNRIIQKILNESNSPQSSNKQKSSIQQYENQQSESPFIEMVIELDSSSSATLKIHSYDDPILLAKSFCFQYSIDPRVINTLANNIKNVQNLQFNVNVNNNINNIIGKQSNNRLNKNNYFMNNQRMQTQNIKNIKNTNNLSTKNNQSTTKSTKNSKYFPSSINNNDEDKQNNQFLSNINDISSLNKSGQKYYQNQDYSRNSVKNKQYNVNNQSTICQMYQNNNMNNYSSNNFKQQNIHSRQSVFDRLYQDSRKKNMIKDKQNINNNNKQNNLIFMSSTQKKLRMSQSKHSLNQSSNFNNAHNTSFSSNPGVYIYQKNTKARQTSMQKRQQQFQQKLSQETRPCTFYPQINPISELIAKKLPNTYRSQRIKNKQMKRIQQYLQQKQKKQIQQCTFQPKILSKSKYTLNRQRSKSASDRLYDQHKKRQMNKKKPQSKLMMLNQSNKNISFKINKVSQHIVGDKKFYQRLKQDQIKRQQHKSILQTKINQLYYKNPQTGRAPANRSRISSIGQHLYNQAKLQQSRSKQRINNFYHNSIQKSRLTCQKSQNIYENSKKLAFQYIFALLDNDQDGVISHTKISLRLPEDVLKLLTPLLIEMEDMQAELDQSQFIEAFNRLFNSFAVVDKQKILQIYKYKKQPQSDNLSFQPSLNEKSIMYMKQSRPEKVNLYDMWKQTQTIKQERLQQIRTLQILEQLQECTFHPKLFR